MSSCVSAEIDLGVSTGSMSTSTVGGHRVMSISDEVWADGSESI